MTKVTEFWDMHSGGGLKEKWHYIYIVAPEEEAVKIFYNKFGHNPHRVTCTCCGNDYSVEEYDSLKQATAFQRGCKYDEEVKKYIEKGESGVTWKEYQTLSQFKKRDDILIIHKKDIKPEWRDGELPEQGYVWVD